MSEIRTALIRNGRYLISSDGNIFSLYFKNRNVVKKRDTPFKMKPYKRGGYFAVCLDDRKSYPVHRILAMEFIEGFKKTDMVNHIDGNKENNNISNLEISNHSHNHLHSLHILGNKTRLSITDKELDRVIDLWAQGIGITTISKTTTISESSIARLLKQRLHGENSKIFGRHYIKVLIGYSKSRHSNRRHEARKALEQLK